MLMLSTTVHVPELLTFYGDLQVLISAPQPSWQKSAQVESRKTCQKMCVMAAISLEIEIFFHVSTCTQVVLDVKWT